MNAFAVIIFAGVPGIAVGAFCLFLLRTQSRREDQQHDQAERRQNELQSMVQRQREEFSHQFAQLGRSVEALEVSARSVEEAGRGLTRSRRAEAMQLLRSGVSPENAAASLNMPRSDVRLMAKVSRILTPAEVDRRRA